MRLMLLLILGFTASGFLVPRSSTAAAPTSSAKITLLNGEDLRKDVTAWTSQGIQLEGESSPRDAFDLRRIQKAVTTSQTTPPQMWVFLVGGGRVAAKDVSLTDGKVKITRINDAVIDTSMDQLRGVQFLINPKDVSDRLMLAALENREIREDQLFAIQPATAEAPVRLVPVSGALSKIDETQVYFVFRGQTRPIARDRVVGLALATPEPEPLARPILTTLNDGTILPALAMTVEKARAKIDLAGGAAVSVPWAEVARVDLRSPRMVFVSDMKPLEVAEDSLLDIARPWQRDLNVRGGPMVLGGRTFEKGLGVRSYSRLVFDAGGQYETFAATIGVDAMTRKKGDCEFVVLGDGQELLRQRMRGSDEPRVIAVPIKGVSRLSLVVEMGEDLSLSDLANWADARFLKGSR